LAARALNLLHDLDLDRVPPQQKTKVDDLLKEVDELNQRLGEMLG
jgi:hypothetical protein